MMETFTTDGYRIEINKDNSNIFKVSTLDGQALEELQDISSLVECKYLPTSKINELKAVCDKIFNEDLNKLQEMYYQHKDCQDFFNRYFQDITLVYKITKVFSKEITKKMVDEVAELVKTQLGKQLPVYMQDNKLNVILMVNPSGYLKSFKSLYDRVIRDGNYSIISQAMELILSVDKIYTVSNMVLEIVDKYE